jgi:hypothetical protein
MSNENLEHYCICLTLDKNQERQRAALLNEAAWNAGDIIKISFLEGDNDLRKRVRAMAEKWLGPGMANLNFQWVDSGKADIRIAFQSGNGSWSYLGDFCRQIPESEPTMNYGWLTPDSPEDELQRVVLHEFGHALGLIHEHQNPKGGIKWNEPAVIADLSGPPNHWDEETIRRNVLDHYHPEQVTATEVDTDSIMMYPIPKSWTLDGFSADLNSDFSSDDISLIHKFYG